MPAQKRVGKRLRTRNAAARKLVALSLDMEDPLNQAIDAAYALLLMGRGLKQSDADEQEGRAVSAVAWTACERLDTLRQAWRNLCKCTLGRS
jgi:hypothetical protein